MLASLENEDHTRCVDVFQRGDGTFGFEEFRRDVEDQGQWVPVQHYSAMAYPSQDEALMSARRIVAWLA